jgi:hypothetical protein
VVQPVDQVPEKDRQRILRQSVQGRRIDQTTHPGPRRLIAAFQGKLHPIVAQSHYFQITLEGGEDIGLFDGPDAKRYYQADERLVGLLDFSDLDRNALDQLDPADMRPQLDLTCPRDGLVAQAMEHAADIAESDRTMRYEMDYGHGPIVDMPEGGQKRPKVPTSPQAVSK